MIALVQGVRRRRHRRSAQVAPQAVPALPRHARPVDQPDSDQGRDEAARPRHRRTAAADDAARRIRPRETAPHADPLRPAVNCRPRSTFAGELDNIFDRLTRYDCSRQFSTPCVRSRRADDYRAAVCAARGGSAVWGGRASFFVALYAVYQTVARQVTSTRAKACSRSIIRAPRTRPTNRHPLH